MCSPESPLCSGPILVGRIPETVNPSVGSCRFPGARHGGVIISIYYLRQKSTDNRRKLFLWRFLKLDVAFILGDGHAIVMLENTADIVNIGHAYVLAGLRQSVAVTADQHSDIREFTAINILHKGNALAAAENICHIIFADANSLGNFCHGNVPVDIFGNKSFGPGAMAAVAGGDIVLLLHGLYPIAKLMNQRHEFATFFKIASLRSGGFCAGDTAN